MNKTNILTVSIIAMMAVGSVRADIASTNYVNAQIQPVSSAVTSLQTNKQDKSSMVTATTGTAYQNIKENIAGDNDITNQYPSIATVGALLKDVADDLGGDVGGKQDTLDSGDGGNVTYSGEGNVVTNISANGGAVTVTKGTTLGSLATKSTVTSSDITNGTIVNEDIADGTIAKGKLASGVQSSLDAADSALPAATYNTQIGTVSAANMGSTASTVVGAISEINDTTNTASLKSRIGKAEGDISQLGEQISTLSSDSQVKSTADYQVGKQGGGWTTLDTNQVAAINSGATSALVGKISTNEAAINTLNGSGAGSVANSIASALTSYSTTAQMNAALDNKADKTTIGTVPENSTVMAEIAKAQNAATYNDTALKNRVAAIEESDAYTSGIDSTKVAQIATNASNISALQSGKQDKIDAQHKLSTDLIANDTGFITKDVNNLTNYTTTTNMNTALAGKQPVSSGVSVGGTGGTWNSLTNGSGITITTNNGTTTIATAATYVPMPSAAGTTGKSVLTYDSEANAGAGAYYWEEIGR